MTRLDLTNRVLQYLRNRDGYETLIHSVLNERTDALAMPFFFPHLEDTNDELSTVAGQDYVDLDEDSLYVVKKVINLDATTYMPRVLDFMEVDDFDRLDNTFESYPTNYTQYGTQLFFYHLPDAAYDLRLRGKRLPVAMAADSDEPELPRDWHPIIAKLTAAEIHFILGEDERGMMIKNEALSEISTRQEVRTMRRSGQEGQIQVRRKMAYRRNRYGAIEE